ncbi:VWA domain-containing protein [Paenibacillus sp. GCM10027626]|uniref:VWA domain-containing protein n=1 Tax=Paenibacillus sp. GCM10027626 TaxID=3273411 RepID=UPI003632E1F1
MGVQFDHPWMLLLLLPWAALLWWMLRSTIRLSGGRKYAAISLRALAMLLIIAVIAGFQPFVTVSQRDVIFVADRSASLDADGLLGQWIASAAMSKEQGDRAAVVAVGRNAVVELPLTAAIPEENKEQFSFRAQTEPSFSHLAQGLQLGSSLLPAEGGRVVLLSDGEENMGDLLRQGRLLRDLGIAVDVLPIAPRERRDAAVERLELPKSLRQAEKFVFQVTIKSTYAGDGELRLYEDNREIAKQSVQLERGENRFALQSVATSPGFHRYRAELYAAGDERAENNAAYAFSRVEGPPSVLIVEGKSGSSANIEKALAASLIRTATIQPEQLPQQLASYAQYDSIILNNVPATRIAAGPMEWLGKAVSDFGVGLVMAGGEESYGLGGYFKTPVERALPVYMDLKGKRKIPSLGLVLVIDKSGSMADGKIELAKEAAIRTVELMRDEDTVGVVAFDSEPWWVIKPTKLTERDDVISSIQGIQADGGTEIYSSLATAYQALRDVKAERKHIILLTDGQADPNAGYGKLTASIVEDKMTLSTVAVGDGADTGLLKQLADAAKGRYYFTNDQSTLPAIFSREAVMMSRTYIVNKRFVPLIGQAGNWSTLFGEGMPAIDAYIATTAKETADAVLLTPDGDPLLARWQYGSGRTVAWTSDLTGNWSADWTLWGKFPSLFSAWVKWTFPQFNAAPYEIAASLEGGETKLGITATDGGSTGINVAITDDNGERLELPALPVRPGEYELTMPAAQPGVYMAKISAGKAGEKDGVTAGFVIPYAPEYRISAGEGGEKLRKLAELTGGRVLSLENPGDVYQFAKTDSRRYADWTRELLIAALLVWLVDIAVRRISIPWARLAQLAGGRRSKQSQTPSAASPAAAGHGQMSRLRQRKEQTRAFYSKEAEPRKSPAVTEREQERERERAKPGVRPPSGGSPKPAEQQAPPQTQKQMRHEAEDRINRLLAAKKRTGK